VGKAESENWQGKSRAYTWQDAIAFAQEILDLCNLKYSVKRSDFAPWHPGRCAELLVDGKAVAHAGELHPRVCSEFGLPPRSCALVINLDALPASDTVRAAVIGSMPIAVQDVALVIDASISAAQLEQALVDGAGELLESIVLFDRYDKIGDGKISLAFTLSFRAPDRTLNGEEISAAREAAVANANKLYGATVRS
jgi:phenylalanyl-tRNA synthetase beta chain